MAPRTPPLALCLTATLAMTSPAQAIAWGSASVTVPLARGVSAQRAPAPCQFSPYGPHWHARAPGCFVWSTRGFQMPPPTLYQRVNMFAMAQGQRIVAATDRGALYTDDRGATWRAAAWDGPQSPLSITFDGETGFAVGTGGAVWMSRDRGATWRVRRDGGANLVDVVALGTLVAFSDERGGVRVSVDGAWSIRSIAERAERAMPVMIAHEGALWVRTEGRRWWRARPDGSVEEDVRPAWELDEPAM